MSSGDVRHSHSASFFKVTRRTEEDINQRPKRLPEEDNTTLAILVDAPSTAMLTEEILEVNNDLLLTENQKERNTTYLAIKLNHLKDKQARFVSHKKFLTHFGDEELVPKGLEVTLEPTIGNHDLEFLDNWYSKQKQFSLSLVKDIVQFCNKTINKTAQDIKNTVSSLKRNTSQSQYHAIQTEINANEDSTRKVLQQQNVKKYSNLKYKPKSTNQTRVQEEQEDLPHEKNGKTLYSDILKRKRSKTDIERKSSKTKISTTTQHKTTIEQLKPLNIKNKKGKPPSRSNSSTNQTKEEGLKRQIKHLQEEIDNLKQDSSSENQSFVNRSQSQLTEPQKQQPKNFQTVSIIDGGQQQNVEIISVISFIEQTMQTLKSFREQLKIQLDTNLIQ